MQCTDRPTMRASYRRVMWMLASAAALPVVLATVTFSSAGGLLIQTRVLSEPLFTIAYPASWRLQRIHGALGVQDQLSSSGHAVNSAWIPARGNVEITILTYSPARMAALLGAGAAAGPLPTLLSQTVTIPISAVGEELLAPARAAQLGGLPAEEISYDYTYHGVPNRQTDVVSRSGGRVVLVELDFDPGLRLAGSRALGRVLQAWRWRSRAVHRGVPSRPTAAGRHDPAFAFGAFAGYDWDGGVVRSVQAAWRVPRILAGSSSGYAGTWLGAEAPGSANRAPFIQVGTNEQRSADRPPRGPRDEYFTFWSDTVNGFHPRRLFTVRPGDRIVAKLTHAQDRWRVTIDDRRSGARRSFLTRDEARSWFGQSEWIQEDVTDSATGGPFPYPSRMTPVHFSGLKVDSRSPSPDQLMSMWMSENRGQIGPSPLERDSFAITTASLSPAGRAYMRLAAPADAAASVFESQRLRWTAATPQAAITAARRRYEAALRSLVDRLGRTRWPAAAEPLMRILIADTRALLTQVQAAPRSTRRSLQSFSAAIDRDAQSIASVAPAVRRALHLPELTPTADSGAGARTRDRDLRGLAIRGAPGYVTFAGPDGKPLRAGQPWGRPCQPIRFAVMPSVPGPLYRQIALVVRQARYDGIDVTLDSRGGNWSPRSLYYIDGQSPQSLVLLPIGATGKAPPLLSDGYHEHINIGWNARPDPDGRHDDLMFVQGVLWLKTLKGHPRLVRHAARQLIAMTQGISGSTRSDSSLPDWSSIDGFTRADIAAMRLMSGCAGAHGQSPSP